MTNTEFLTCITRSFQKFLNTGSRSNQKLKILHGEIAEDLSNKLGKDYSVKSLGFQKGKEAKIEGRYINKQVDITILKDDIPIAGIAIKFVMQNYSQNANNYFEGMLGETVNIRCKDIPYFQILIIPDEIPYYKKDGVLKNWETFSINYAKKYQILATDIAETSIHTPSKTLLYVIKLPDIADKTTIKNKTDYISHYQSIKKFEILPTNISFGTFAPSVLFNDYSEFMTKIVYRILSI